MAKADKGKAIDTRARTTYYATAKHPFLKAGTETQLHEVQGAAQIKKGFVSATKVEPKAETKAPAAKEEK